MKKLTASTLIPLFGIIALGGCSKEADVSYSRDIQPILEQNCFKCHTDGGKGEQKSGLNMSTYENLMHGTKLGAVIQPGSSISSTLIALVEGRADPSIKMPHGEDQKRISAAEISKIKTWIDQGAKNN